MSAAPVLRRSTRNAAKRESPAVTSVEQAAPAAKKKRTTEKKAASAASKKAAAAAAPAAESAPPAAAAATATTSASAAAAPAGLKDGDVLPGDLPEIQTHTGESTTLAALVKASEKGIVIFAYPRASTPGCTTQACAFRDATASFKEAGYAVYGLSGDLPAANEKFKAKQNLADITMLCDPKYELHARLAIKKQPASTAAKGGTIRSVVVIGKKQDSGDGDQAAAVILKKSAATPTNSVEIAKKAIGISDGSDGKKAD